MPVGFAASMPSLQMRGMPNQFDPTMYWANVTGLLAPRMKVCVDSNCSHCPALMRFPWMPSIGGIVWICVLSSAATTRQTSGSGVISPARGLNLVPM